MVAKRTKPSRTARGTTRSAARRTAADTPAQRPRAVDARTRWLLVSDFVPGFTLYYDVSEGMYAMNEPGRATLFRRREHAIAVQTFLGPKSVVVRCRVDVRGVLVIESLPRRYGRTPSE